MTEQMDVYKSQAKQILRKLNARSPHKQIIESGPCSFLYVYTHTHAHTFIHVVMVLVCVCVCVCVCGSALV